MKYILTAFILSIIIHLSLLYTIKDKKVETSEKSTSSETQKKSSVHFVKLLSAKEKEPEKTTPKKQEEKKVKKTVKKAPPIKELKKVKKVVKEAKREVVKKEPKKIEKKVLKKEEIPSLIEVNPTQLQKKAATKIQNEPVDLKLLDKITRDLIELYGKEYDSLTKVQKVFLQDNLSRFQRITQVVLNRMGYPRMAAKLRLSGTNVVEFVFHPNGDISDLRITNSSGHAVFDNYTLELIEIAYKNYPRPKEATKIRFDVIYRAY